MSNIRVSVRVKGDKELAERFRQMPVQVKAGLNVGLIASALIVQNAARGLVQKSPRSGRTYKRRGVQRRASAPGEPPATDTGTLVRNIVADPQPDNNEIAVHVPVEYAGFLEFGTRFMKPRPFLRRALSESVDKILAVIKQSIVARLK